MHDEPLRVLHGLTGAAGQPWIVSRAQRRLGLHADCVSMTRSKFSYGADRHLVIDSDELTDLSRYLVEACHDYDVFHFYFRPFFLFDSRSLAFPTALDLLTLRAAGKTLIFHYSGSEVRTAEKFRQLSPFHYVDENPSRLFDKFPPATVEALHRFVQGIVHAVLVPDPELRSYVPDASIVPRAVDLKQWGHVGVPDDDVPLVVHAPSRRTVKGTDFLLDAVDGLRKEGLRFRFKLVENLDNSEAREIYRTASIIVDQLRIGWYGVLAVEAMALGKATVSYIRDDLVHHLEPDPPLACANPNTIKDVLRELIIDKARRQELGRLGRAYCERVHDADLVASQLIDLYRKVTANPPPVSVEACLDYLRVQREHTGGVYKQLQQRPESLKSWFWKYMMLIDQTGVRNATRQAMHKVWRELAATLGKRTA